MYTPTESAEENFLDIRSFVCPMTFVRAKMFMEKLPEGATAKIRLNDGEALTNVPRSLKEQGFEILAIAPGHPQPADGDREAQGQAAEYFDIYVKK